MYIGLVCLMYRVFSVFQCCEELSYRGVFEMVVIVISVFAQCLTILCYSSFYISVFAQCLTLPFGVEQWSIGACHVTGSFYNGWGATD